MKQIPLTQGKFALVDDEDYEWAAKLTWCYDCGYASFRVHKKRNGKWSGRNIRMHNLIMNTPNDMHTDHIDGNRLNNQRSNLRVCTHAENQRNKQKKANTSSKFKGVCWNKRKSLYVAYIGINKEHIHLGYFDCQIEAAKAYNLAAIKHHGEFACLNNV